MGDGLFSLLNYFEGQKTVYVTTLEILNQLQVQAASKEVILSELHTPEDYQRDTEGYCVVPDDSGKAVTIFSAERPDGMVLQRIADSYLGSGYQVIGEQGEQ